MLFIKSIFTVISLVAAASSALAAPSRLTKRDFFCDVKNVHCCDELLSNKEAGEALGGILNIPASIIGNVGLGCSVSLHSSHLQPHRLFPRLPCIVI
jgi:hypothetical protein